MIRRDTSVSLYDYVFICVYLCLCVGGLIYNRQFRNVIIRRDASVSGFRSRCSAAQAVYHLKKNCHMTNPPTHTPCTLDTLYFFIEECASVQAVNQTLS